MKYITRAAAVLFAALMFAAPASASTDTIPPDTDPPPETTTPPTYVVPKQSFDQTCTGLTVTLTDYQVEVGFSLSVDGLVVRTDTFIDSTSFVQSWASSQHTWVLNLQTGVALNGAFNGDCAEVTTVPVTTVAPATTPAPATDPATTVAVVSATTIVGTPPLIPVTGGVSIVLIWIGAVVLLVGICTYLWFMTHRKPGTDD